MFKKAFSKDLDKTFEADEPSVPRHVSFSEEQDAPVWETGDNYVQPGFRGIFSNSFVFFCATFATLGGLIFGYDQGVISVILVMEQFLDRFVEIKETHASSGFYKGLLTAMIELGALVGALVAGYIADRLSRRVTIIVAVAVFTIGSALQTGAVDYPMLTVARLIGGFGIGALSMIAPLYISEISPPEIRGTLLVLQEFSVVTGIVIAFWITYGTRYILNEWSWRLPFLLQMVPGVILVIGILFMPYSPRWLCTVGRDQDALESLSRLRALPADDRRVVQEWNEIRAEVIFQREVSTERHPHLQGKSPLRLEMASWGDLFSKEYFKRTHVGVGISFFQQFVGINALIYYSPTLFATMGLDYDLQLILSGVLNVTQLVGIFYSFYAMDRFGRRSLLLTGGVLMTISQLIIAVMVGKYSYDWPSHRMQGWVSVAFLFFYMLSFGGTWGPVPWALPSEIFPSRLRAKGVAISTGSIWLNNFIIGLITPPLVQNTGFGAYTFFAVFCALSLIWVYFIVPETNGRSLEQMDAVFGDRTGERDAARKAEIERELFGRDITPTSTHIAAPAKEFQD